MEDVRVDVGVYACQILNFEIVKPNSGGDKYFEKFDTKSRRGEAFVKISSSKMLN
jgi:hypothetical protein